MVSRKFFLASLFSAFTPGNLAKKVTTPSAPGLTYLYGLNCTIAFPYVIGNVTGGERVAIPITGGYFKGPRLSGRPGSPNHCAAPLTPPPRRPSSPEVKSAVVVQRFGWRND